MNRRDDAIRRLNGGQRFESGRNFSLEFGEDSASGLGFQFTRGSIEGTGFVDQSMLNGETESIDACRIAMIAGCINREFSEIQIVIAVWIGRVIQIGAGESIVIGFDVQWCTGAKEHSAPVILGKVAQGASLTLW